LCNFICGFSPFWNLKWRICHEKAFSCLLRIPPWFLVDTVTFVWDRAATTA
jgi:hypothetical protein